MNHSKSAVACIFCEDATENPVEMGDMLTYEDINAHHYCLLLSSNLTQNGEDDEGILGFLPADINVELKRAQKMKCYYCKRPGASIGCCNKKCRRAFHLPCAILNDCLFQFTDTFRSFCDAHHGFKRPKHVHAAGDECTICLDKMGEYRPVRSVKSPCCSRWFHKRCLMETARSFGYFFKCPLCNNKDKFRDEIVLRGIFIPDKDAAWEAPNDPLYAFAELTERPNHCSAKTCQCPQGRKYIARKENTKFALIYCKSCGSRGIHIHCNKSNVFDCKRCIIPNRTCGTVDNKSDENVVDLHGSDNAEHELSSENERRIESKNGGHCSSDISNSSSSSSAQLINVNHTDPDKSFFDHIRSDKDGSVILVHTRTRSLSSTYSISTSVQAVCDSNESDVENDEYTRSIGLNRSNRICSSIENRSHQDAIITETASETKPLLFAEYDPSADNRTAPSCLNNEDVRDDEKIKPVTLSSRKNRTRISSSSSSMGGTKNTFNCFSKRKRNTAFPDSSSDDESFIENQDAIRPNKQNKLLNTNNNNNASTPLLEDNKNKWNRKIVEIS